LFGLGQCFGPVVAGYLSDSSMGIRLGFIVSIVALVLGAGVATLQQEPGAKTGREDT
jgi:MFS family permease